MLKKLTNVIVTVVMVVTILACEKEEKHVSNSYITQTVEAEEDLLVGRHYLENGGCITISKSREVLYTIESECQDLITVNPKNSTFGQFPRIHQSYLTKDEQGMLRFSKDLNYTDGNDIEEDVSGGNVRGRKKTNVVVSVVDGKVHIQIQVYSNRNNDNINFIRVDRTLKEL